VVTVRNGRVDAERVNATQFSPFRSHVLVSGGENAVVQLWDTVKVSAALSTLRTHTGAVTSLTFSPVNELLLCSAGSDAQIVFYDINQSKSIKALKCPSP
jgi:WD40 repeat protein